MKVSVVIPCYYSENMIGTVVKLTREQLIKGGYDYEFILVNDGSTDGTFASIEKLCAEDPHIVGIDCAINLGQHSAIMAGLNKAEGDLIMLMDDDMQTHPSQCLKLVDKAATGEYDVVFARWPEHKEKLWRRLGSKFNAWTTRKFAGRPAEIYSSNYLVMQKFVRDEIIRYDGPYTSIEGLLFRTTRNMTNVDVEHFERMEGTSGYTLRSLVHLWSGFLGFSMAPLRIGSVVGVIIGIVGLVIAIVVAIQKLLNPAIVAGWTSLIATVLICSSLIMVFLGIIGEYIGRLYMSINKAPQFVAKTVIDRRESLESGSSEKLESRSMADEASADMRATHVSAEVDA